MRGSILIADDESGIRESLTIVLQDEGYHCTAVQNGKEAIEAINSKSFDIIISDLKMPKVDGLGVLEHALQHSSDTLTIIITAHGTIETAIQALRKGAADYILKPLDFDEVLIRVENLLEQKKVIQENKYLREQIDQEYNFNHIIGESDAMKRVYKMVERVSGATSNVLITGESGTGKELVARAIHFNGDRAKKPFLAINCGAIPEDLIESELFGHKKGAFTGATSDKDGVFVAAHGGTVFLDEVAEIPLNLQVNLLRVLQEREVKPVGANQNISFDTRIISATNKDLAKEIENGTFRDDLYYRLNVVELQLPSLQHRREDIPLLAHHFLQKYNKELSQNIKGVSSEAMSAMMAYEWKGQVRELENIIERAVLLSDNDYLLLEDLPSAIREVADSETMEMDTDTLDRAVRVFEKHHIQSMLRRTEGNKSEAARLLGIDPSTLYRKMERLGLSE
ncbi:sigma-54-dependent transcriptional regulator [Fodinibius sediminis]|uniref:Two component, sigma54 specific, transcriptional regulator, Fis family n=1 Tax=Fodinibius sediminis TaxID=1214077 RepID=A0A521BHV3_9BACT|nr:sigma-54 dependent transcriptional regulator [Fodinibius sediminis]SMO46718.1 two component, sigma54 specific, transcriptional regulator, Fis family [Fodinibius sediminis]